MKNRHKHSVEHYEAVAILLGGKYDPDCHTIFLGLGAVIAPADKMFDPDTMDELHPAKTFMRWGKYHQWRHPK